jgi:hypothetical protein
MAAEDRIHGSHGQVKMDPAGGASTVVVASMNSWDLDMSKEHAKVTAFGDSNQVYVDGLPDIKGTYGGWFDPVDGLVIFDAIFGNAKPTLELFPSDELPLIKFSGRALIDGKISVDSNGGVSVGGGFVAAGSWVIPTAA